MDFVNLFLGGSVNYGTLFTNVLFCICCVILLGKLEVNVRSILFCILEAILLFALATVLEVLQFELFNESGSFIPLGITLITYALIQHRRTATDRIVRCVTFMSAFVLIVSMTGIEMDAIPALKRLPYGDLVPSAISYASMLIFAIVLRHFSISEFSFVPRYFVLLIVLIDVFGAYAGLSYINYTSAHQLQVSDMYANMVLSRYEYNMAFLNLQTDASFLLLMLVAYIMFYVLAKEHDQRTELLVTKKSEIDALSMAKVTRDSYERIREMRHEIKNHDAYVLALLEAGEYEKAKDYFVDQAHERAGVLNYVSSGNLLVDGVVNSKMSLARSQGVEIHSVLAVPPELPFEEGDIFRLLANMLDNAIEGTLASDSKQGPIGLKFIPTAGYYLVVVSNPCRSHSIKHNNAGDLVSTKKDKDIHGFGTKVIRQIAEKYQGTARFVVENGTFTASVMLSRGEGDNS